MNKNLWKAYKELKTFVQKAKELPVGTRREWNGKPYVKTNNGWRPVPKGKQETQPTQTTPKQNISDNVMQKRQQEMQNKKKAWQAIDNKGSDLNKLIGRMASEKDGKLKNALEQEIYNYSKRKGYDEGSIKRAILEAKNKNKMKNWGIR